MLIAPSGLFYSLKENLGLGLWPSDLGLFLSESNKLAPKTKSLYTHA